MEVKTMGQIFEYRGVEGLVYAEVIKDNNSTEQGEGYVTGTVKPLAGVAEISKTTESSNEPHYYDNIPAVVVSSTGSDEITISASAIPLDVLADITGQYYDSATGTFVEKERAPKYFAIGYQTKTTDGDVMYVWRLKGSFNIPDQTNVTEDDGTDANGQELTFTGISTTHKFTKTSSPAKAVTVNTGLDLIADKANFFTAVQTPDTITAKA
jgi:phi13 family phage major tail protein